MPPRIDSHRCTVSSLCRLCRGKSAALGAILVPFFFSRHCIRCLLCVICVLCAPWVMHESSAWAAPFDVRGEDWEGLGQLVRIAEGELGTQRVVALSARGPGRATVTLPLHDLKREDAVLLVHPERALDVDELAAFMRAGGRVVLLDDYGSGDDLLARFGIRRVPLPARPAEMLRGNPSFAIAEAASGHSAVRDVAHVVTNHGTGLAHPALSRLLVVRSAHTDAPDEPDVMLALAGAVGQGRLIAVGDASIAINSMLRFPGNRTFCTSLVRYATEDDAWGARNGKLYILANDFEMTGGFGDDSRLGGATNQARRALLEALETLRRDGMPPLVAYLVAVALGLALVVWTSTRAGKTHRAVLPRYVRPIALAAQGGVAGRAAVVGAPGASRVLAVLELKSALEEELAARLGLDRVPAHDELVARAQADKLLDEESARELSRLLASLTQIETMLAMRKRPVLERLRDADVFAIAARVRRLLASAGHAGAPGPLEP